MFAKYSVHTFFVANFHDKKNMKFFDAAAGADSVI